jgi:hypothetical protein
LRRQILRLRKSESLCLTRPGRWGAGRIQPFRHRGISCGFPPELRRNRPTAALLSEEACAGRADGADCSGNTSL